MSLLADVARASGIPRRGHGPPAQTAAGAHCAGDRQRAKHGDARGTEVGVRRSALWKERHRNGDSVGSITSADISDFYATHFGPKDSALVLSGDVTRAQAESLAREYFGKWTGKTAGAAARRFQQRLCRSRRTW